MAGAKKRTIGLFGGSFDPPHVGHLHVARRASEAFGLQRVVFVPAARPPHKPGRVLAPDADRLAMLGLLVAGEGRFSVADLELERDGPSFTFDTVTELCQSIGEGPEAGIALMIGSDNLQGFERWHRVVELLELVQPIIVRRSDGAVKLPDALTEALSLDAVTRLRAGVLDHPPLTCSSSELRQDLAHGRSTAGRIPGPVAEWIRARGLYRAGAE